MSKSLLSLLICIVFSCLCVSYEEVEDFGFPSKTEISAAGEPVDIMLLVKYGVNQNDEEAIVAV